MNDANPKRHILIVDDDPDMGWLLKRYLERASLAVSLARSGKELRAAWPQQSFDLVVVDVALPDEDGFRLVQWLRESDYQGGIVMLTASTDSSDTVMGLDLGADDYVTKPFEPRIVLARIKSVMRSRASRAS